MFLEGDRFISSISNDRFSGALRALRDPGVDVAVLSILLHELPPLGFQFEEWKQVEKKASIGVFPDHTEVTAVIMGRNEQLALTIVDYGDRAAFSWKRGSRGPVDKMLGATLEFVLNSEGHFVGSATYSESRGRIEIISGKIVAGSLAFQPYEGMKANARQILYGISDLRTPFDVLSAFPRPRVPGI